MGRKCKKISTHSVYDPNFQRQESAAMQHENALPNKISDPSSSTSSSSKPNIVHDTKMNVKTDTSLFDRLMEPCRDHVIHLENENISLKKELQKLKYELLI